MPNIEHADYLDSRELLKHMGDLESDIISGPDLDRLKRTEKTTLGELTDEELNALANDADADAEYDAADLIEYRKLIGQVDRYATNKAKDGVTLIREGYFPTYAQELAEDIGAIGKDATWPLAHIDWCAAAADELKTDYRSAEFDGETYWFR